MAKRKKDSEDQNENLNENNGGEDNFGLPDLEYKPLEEEEVKEQPQPEPESEVVASETSAYQSDPPRKSEYSYTEPQDESKTPVIIGIVIVLIIAVTAYLIYQFVYKPQAEKERKELLAKQAEEKRKADEARLAKEREEEEARKRREAEEAAKAVPTTGEIVSLTDRTGRYYVVVASAVDGDLIMDYAKKLKEKGTGSKIIPPFGKWKYYRLAISDHDTFANAQAVADQSKPQFGEATWVIKY